MKFVVNARFLTQEITGVQRYAIEISLQLKAFFKDNAVFVAPPNIIHHGIGRCLGVIIVGRHTGHIWEQYDLPRYLQTQDNPLLLCLCNTAPLFYENKVVTIHDVAFEVFPQTFSKSFLLYYKFLIPKIVRNSRTIVTVSDFSKSELIRCYKINKDKIIVVYNAVTDKFRHVEDLSLRKNQYFLAVSSLNYRKNFFAVLKAFDLYSQQNANSNLYIIGDMQSKSFGNIDIDEYRGNPRIKFLGRVSDEELIRYYSNALGFIFPSFYEGFGIPPLEAQACGCPVLCSDIPVLHEVCGDSALYSFPYDLEGLSHNMSIIVEKREELISNGYNNVSRFSWETSGKRLYGFLSLLLR